MKYRAFGLLVIISLALEILLSPIRGYIGINICSLIGFIAFFILTFWSVKRLTPAVPKVLIFLFLSIGLFIIQLPLRFIHFSESLFSLPDFVCHFLGIVAGVMFSLTNAILRWGVVATGLALSLYICIAGYQLWLNKLNFGTFTGDVNYKLQAPIEGYDVYGHKVSLAEMKDKYVIIDFWNTGCGVCFTKFPKFQKLYDTYKSDRQFAFLSINKPLQRDTLGQAFATLQKKNYSFPIMVPRDTLLPDLLGINYYPTTMIIDKHGSVIFKGSVEGLESLLLKLKKNSH